MALHKYWFAGLFQVFANRVTFMQGSVGDGELVLPYLTKQDNKQASANAFTS